MTENFSKNSARDAAGLSHPLRSGSPRRVSPQGFAAGFTAIRVRRQVRRRGFAARVRRRGKMFPRQLLSGNYYPSNYYPSNYCRATTIGQLLSRQLLSSATTIRPEEAHLTTALAFLWYFCYFTTVPIVRNRHAVVYAPKATRKCTKKPRRKSKTTRFPEGHRLVQTEFKPRASSTRVTGTGSANSGSRICS